MAEQKAEFIQEFRKIITYGDLANLFDHFNIFYIWYQPKFVCFCLMNWANRSTIIAQQTSKLLLNFSEQLPVGVGACQASSQA